MNTIEHLLTILGEEGAEIAKDCSKSNRFGLDDTYTHIAPDGSQEVRNEMGTNRERLINELNDLLGVVGLLVEQGALPENWHDPIKQQQKQVKVFRYMTYARAVGKLTGLLLLLCSIAGAQPLPEVKALKVDTNLYWLPFGWDVVTNASSYSITVFSNSAVQQIVTCNTNYAAVSNLPSALDAFQFKAQAINSAGVSDLLYTSDDLITWFKAPGVEYDSSTNASRYLRLSNWTYATALHRQ